MPGPRKRPPLPTREEIVNFIRESPTPVGRREIARAFHVRGADHKMLASVFRELEEEGLFGKRRRKRGTQEGLPPVGVIEVTGIDADGDVLARPQNWENDAPPPRVYLNSGGRRGSAPAPGDKVLARLALQADGSYRAEAIRRLEAAAREVYGVYRKEGRDGRIVPADRRVKTEFIVVPGDTEGALPGELVRAETRLAGRRFGLPHARIVERICREDAPGAASLLAATMQSIPMEFPEDALLLAAGAKAAPVGNRADLRDTPLVTIDDASARDFDDAVWAAPDTAPGNPGGWVVLVAIADVSWYVRPGDSLDRAAHERGNSVYFPDRVIPMLPEKLSNGWCSLKPGEDRPVLAVSMWFNRDGQKQRHEFVRGTMRSAARLTYQQVQQVADGAPDDVVGPLSESLIAPLYGAYRALRAARDARGALDLDIPERRIILGEDGNVASIERREVLDSHRLIEEFMVAANVAAAETLEQHSVPCMYRVHDTPDPERVEGLRAVLETIGIRLARGQVLNAGHFNGIVENARDTADSALVSEAVLRCQAQAVYSPDNLGHFGLGLRRYAHFTSPIRRYSDLLVHRALIAALDLGAGGSVPGDGADFEAVGRHISTTERRASAAERNAMDRLTVAYLADRTGAVFKARVNGVARFGVFVTLIETGAGGLMPLSALGDERFRVDERRQSVTAGRGRVVVRLGDSLDVRLVEANPLTGSMVFEPVARKGDGKRRNSGPLGRGGGRKTNKRKRRPSGSS